MPQLTAQFLSRVPAMRPEVQHVLLIMSGALHTLLCSSKAQLEEMGSDEVLQLQWSWSVKDVFAVANVILLGATFSSTAGGGNEPPFCLSFAAGITLRVILYDWMPNSSAAQLATFVRQQAQIELIGVDQVAVRAGGSIGTCSGGPVRALLGWLDRDSVLMLAATATKIVLLCLPTLAIAQWALRCMQLAQRLRREVTREGKARKLRSGEMLVPVLRRRLAFSSFITISVTALVIHFGTFELNAINSSLGNLLILALAGCLLESLLSTYDVRGRLRSVFFFVFFMFL